MKDIDNFMKWEYLPDLDIKLSISGADFIDNQPIVADDLKPIISEWWTKCRNLHCTIDLKNIKILKLDILAVIRIINDLSEYNKECDMLKSIEFTNCNYLIRWIYRGVSVGIPKSLRDIIHLSSASRNVT